MKCSGSFAKYDHDTCSWKTSQLLLTGDSEPFSGAWPKAGTMQDGAVYRRPKWERPMEGKGSGVLPTPSANDWKHVGTVEAAKRYIKRGHQIKITVLMQAKGFGRPHAEPIEEMMGYLEGWTALDA